jgi:hypothetical protein
VPAGCRAARRRGGARLWRARAPGPQFRLGGGFRARTLNCAGGVLAATLLGIPGLRAAERVGAVLRVLPRWGGARSPTLHILPRQEARSPASCRRRSRGPGAWCGAGPHRARGWGRGVAPPVALGVRRPRGAPSGRG